MALISKTARILDSMVGRRTNNDILRMASLYLGTRIDNEEYDYLLERMILDGIEGPPEELSEARSEVLYCNPICCSTEPAQRYRKNKQGHSKGKPKRKR